MDKDLFRYKIYKKIAEVKNDIYRLDNEVETCEFVYTHAVEEEYTFLEAQIDAFNEVLRMLEE